MKIILLANSINGLYSFRKELVWKLLESHEVFIAAPAGDYTEYFAEIGCHMLNTDFELRGTNLAKEMILLKTYISMLRKIRPSVVLTYTIKPNTYGGMACRMLRIPYIANITGLGTAVENDGIMQKIALALYRIALKKAKIVFFQNQENLQFMTKRNVINGAYSLLPGSGVNLDIFRPISYPQSGKTEFIFISRIIKEKGIDQYLDAAKQIKSRYPETVFHICGECNEEYEKTIQQLHEEGIIVYHGKVKNVEQYIAPTHCTIHPTYYPEGMSNVLLESAASCKPIITTDRAGCREIVDDGINGFVVKQQDSQDLIEKIEKFLALPWEKRRDMGLAGRTKVEKEFDRRIVVEKYMRELEK